MRECDIFLCCLLFILWSEQTTLLIWFPSVCTFSESLKAYYLEGDDTRDDR